MRPFFDYYSSIQLSNCINLKGINILVFATIYGIVSYWGESG